MSTPSDAYFVRRGFDAKISRHGDNVARALDQVRRNLAAASDSLHSDRLRLDAFRQLVVDAAEAAQQAAALAAVLEVAKFARPEEDR